MNKKINEIRHEYNKGSLSRNDMPKSPFAFFEQWYKHAIDLDVYEPNAMAISTVNNENCPTSRMVLLRGFDENGFVFYTNYNSKKGNNLIQNKKASLLFYWHQLHRQIRIEGNCEKVEEHVSTKYFHSRPKASQIASAISPQSEQIENRQILIDALELKTAKENDNSSIERPKHWGGFCLVPNYFEFWLGRPSRLHDRFSYTKDGENWKINRLAP